MRVQVTGVSCPEFLILFRDSFERYNMSIYRSEDFLKYCVTELQFKFYLSVPILPRYPDNNVWLSVREFLGQQGRV